MLEFLISLLLLILSQQPAIPDEVREIISQNLTEYLQNVQNTPNENANPQDIISGNLSPTPIEQEEDNQEVSSTDSLPNNITSPNITNNSPDTDKTETYNAHAVPSFAYNSKSEKPIGEVANVAVQNSPALIPCSENPENCGGGKEPPTPTPSPSPIPLPEPTVVIKPESVYPPITTTPHIPEPPYNPCGCSGKPNVFCPTVYICLDSL